MYCYMFEYNINLCDSQGQAVLVPPQQQMVHTSTGVEVLSSSPTSSHTDYMPATSSATVVIRQAAVPPTQQPPPSAESTQVTIY